MKNEQKKDKVKGSINYYDSVDLRRMLLRPGFNNKALQGENFLNVHWLKVNLKRKIEGVAEAVEMLAKETKHEIIPYGDQLQYALAKEVETKDADGKVIDTKVIHEKATKEFIEKKKLIEDVELEGIKLNFMSVDDFRAWVDSVDCQFELAEYILNI